MEESASSSKSENKLKKSKEHNLRKRRPQKPERSEGVIYVSTKTSTNALFDKCSKLINNNHNEITLYCLGAAIQRGIVLALKVADQHVAYQIHTNTFTTELIDDLEPAADDADYAIQRRFNSAVKIKLFRKDPLES